MSGPAEMQFLTASRRYTALTRVVVALVVEALALLVTPSGRVWPASAVLLAIGVWGGFYLLMLRHRTVAWVIWCDVAVVSAAALARPWLDAPHPVADGSGWVHVMLLAAVSAHQWQFPRTSKATLVAVGAVPATAFGAGALLMTDSSVATSLTQVVWPAILAAISSALFHSMRAAARGVDKAAAKHAQARAEVEIAAARRASKADQLAALHDTAAATLMMVGLGMVGLGEVNDGERRLREQAGRDLEALIGRPPPTGDGVASGLRSVVGTSGLSVRVAHSPAGLPARLPAGVEAALMGAVGEALRNVTRHAGVTEAQILLDHSSAGIHIEVRDSGVGFVDHAASWNGRGIQHSIIQRMERVGGRATVISSAAGVTVRLQWPRG